MITKQIATSLRLGQTLYHCSAKNADGTRLRARVNGQCKVWVTRPDEWRLPVKHGLRDCFYITERNAHEWDTEE